MIGPLRIQVIVDTPIRQIVNLEVSSFADILIRHNSGKFLAHVSGTRYGMTEVFINLKAVMVARSHVVDLVTLYRSTSFDSFLPRPIIMLLPEATLLLPQLLTQRDCFIIELYLLLLPKATCRIPDSLRILLFLDISTIQHGFQRGRSYLCSSSTSMRQPDRLHV